MAIDPSAIVGYSLMGAGSGLVNRVMQHLFPTPLEKAQAYNIFESLKLSRERLEREEARVTGEWNVRRKLLIEQLAANETIEQNRDLRRRWPLELPAAAFVRYSQKHQGSALNVVVRPITRLTGGRTESEISTFSGVVAATDMLMDSVPRYFDHDIIYYREVVAKSRDPVRAALEGQQLDAAMYSLAGTEPTALLQVSVDGASEVRVRYCCWGWSGESGFPMSGALVLEGADMTASNIENALLPVICALHDQFRAVGTLANPATPHMFKLLGRTGSLTYRDDRSAAIPAAAAKAAEILVGSYTSALEIIAGRVPMLAAECAANSALAAQSRSQPELAERLLSAAIRYCTSSNSLNSKESSAVIQTIMGPSNHGAPSVLRDALQKIRLLDPADFITSERKPFPADTFTEEIIVFRSHKDSKKNIKEDQPSFVETFKRFFTGEGSIHDVLSYDFVIRYSTSERPIKIVSARSVLMIRDGKDNLVLIQSFVDENDHPIYGSDGNMIGRSLNFKKLDQSLAELFDGKNLVVID